MTQAAEANSRVDSRGACGSENNENVHGRFGMYSKR